MFSPDSAIHDALSRRAFLGRSSHGIGALALTSLLNPGLLPTQAGAVQEKWHGLLKEPHLPPKIKRVIWLTMAGGPSHLETFDYKPQLAALHDQPMPDSLTKGQQLAQLQGAQLKCFGPQWGFKKFGQSGAEMCELFPQLGSVADDICIIRSMHTEAINHDPAHCFINTGSTIPGRPAMGAWITYGLGSDSEDLPGFVVLTSNGKGGQNQPIAARQWSSGFLPSRFQGVQLRGKGDPVLYLSNPAGVSRDMQGDVVRTVNALNAKFDSVVDDPEIGTRIAQYEMAFSMQASVPELMDTTKEPQAVLDLYGCKPGDGSFAANCLLARRLAERGVRFIQCYHKDWDHHGGIKEGIKLKAEEVDRACMALITDLKQRGMFDDTLIVWSGEFGRTPMSQGGSGRDHHMLAFSVWLAGGGIKGGVQWGETDEFGYKAVRDVVHVHDLHATMLYLLGIEHTRLTYRFQGRDYRLTDVFGKVIKGIPCVGDLELSYRERYNFHFENGWGAAHCRVMPAAPTRTASLIRGALLFLAGAISAVIVVQLMDSGETKRSDPGNLVAGGGRPNSKDGTSSPDNRREDSASGDPVSRLSEAITSADRDSRMEKLRHLAEELAATDPEAALQIAAKIPDTNDRLEFLRAVFAKWAAKDPTAALTAALKFPAGTIRSETIDAALGTWAAREPRSAIGWVDSNLTGPLKEEALVMVTMKWASADPEAAGAWFVSTGSTSESVLTGLINSWADLDPAAAARWIDTLKDDRSKTLGRIALVLEWSNQNPAEASAYAMPYITKPGGNDLAEALVNAWGSTDPHAAAQWVDTLPTGRVRDEAAGALATIWAAHDITAATQWATQLPESQLKSGVIDHIATTWGAIEPQKALAWVDTLPPGETRVEATRGAMDSWAATDAGGMAKWIASQPAGSVSDQARVSLGEVQIDREPADAMQTAMGINDPAMRRDEMVKYYRRWSRRDVTSANAWLQSAPIQPDLRTTLASSIRR